MQYYKKSKLKLKFLLILVVSLLISCDSSNNNVEKNKVTELSTVENSNKKDTNKQIEIMNDDGVVINDTLPFLDTTIVVKTLQPAYIDEKISQPLTALKARKMLNCFYEKLDYFTENNLPSGKEYFKLKSNKNKFGLLKLHEYFGSINILNLNGDSLPDAVVQFMLVPPYGSSRCYSQTKAIILSLKSGYGIYGIDFIPTLYIIENIKQSVHHTAIINGYDYDCANFRINRYFRIKLMTK